VAQSQAKVERVQTPGALVWLDLEMTGLDAQTDVILQAAVIVTTPNLQPLEQYVCDVWQPDAALSRMGPFVRDMHEKNGLLTRVRASKVELRDCEKALLEIVSGWCAYPATLCGNSIGQDKRFVDRWMPGLAAYLSYRLVDVSSIKVLARTWYGETSVYPKPEEGAHDALFDVQQSIAELAHYRATLFVR